MATYTRYVHDQMREIVATAATKSGIAVFYQFCGPQELIQNLRDMTRDPKQVEAKYPLVALLANYTEIQGETPGIESRVSLNLVIATLTEARYSTEERDVVNFKPILYPIFDALITSIYESGYYQMQTPEVLRRHKTANYRWGKNGLYLEDGDVFEDMIDAIEINNMELLVINKQNNL